MNYCKRCILPDTRPNLTLDAEGICNACRAHESRPEIDWVQRERVFRELIENAKSRSLGYDCLIPVSGGKDSTWQVIKCLEYGLNPLAVTWKNPARTEIGIKNLENLISLGVDHIDYQINPKVERKFLLKALEKFGATAIPMHMAMFNIPLTIAVRFKIPLVIWGENSAAEYGGTDDEQTGFLLDKKWIKKFGVTHGTTAKDWVSSDLTEKELSPYFGPSDQEMENSGVSAIFLGYYFPWAPHISLAVAQAHGFQIRKEGPKTGFYNYADIDDDFISIHHWMKLYKFGFTRLFDNLSLEIRNGRITRDDAIQIVKEYGDQTPYDDIKKFCKYVNISTDRFFSICETFRNSSIWTKNQGKWMINEYLIPDWRWI